MGQQACYRDRLLSAQISINLARQYLADAARRGYFCACTVHKRLILLVLKRSNLVEVVDKRRFVLVGLAEAAGKVHLPFSDAVRNADLFQTCWFSELSKRSRNTFINGQILYRSSLRRVLRATLTCSCYVACQGLTSILALENTCARALARPFAASALLHVLM